jgi:hypothetical protein
MQIRPARGFERAYFVSDTGLVFHRNTDGSLNEVHPYLTKGYPVVRVSDGTAAYRPQVPVHRLVATTFIPTAQPDREVNHIDGNKENNRVENLEWVTAEENIQHAQDLGLSPPSKPVVATPIDPQREPLVFPSIRSTKRNGFDDKSVAACCAGRQKTHHGYMWRYA